MRWLRRFWAHRASLALLFTCVWIPLAVAAGFGEQVRDDGALPFDVPVLRYLHEHASSTSDGVMAFFTEAGRLIPMTLITLALAGVLGRRNRKGRAIFVLVAGAGSFLINVSIKAIYHRDRPALWESILPETTYSFPSGHAMGSMTLACTLAVVAWPTRWRWPAIVAGAIFTLLVGVSRVYLGVHYPSDVLAGWLAALAWVVGLYLVVRHRPDRWPRRRIIKKPDKSVHSSI